MADSTVCLDFLCPGLVEFLSPAHKTAIPEPLVSCLLYSETGCFQVSIPVSQEKDWERLNLHLMSTPIFRFRDLCVCLCVYEVATDPTSWKQLSKRKNLCELGM